MNTFPRDPHPGLKHTTPEGRRFFFNGRAWLPDRSPTGGEANEPGGSRLTDAVRQAASIAGWQRLEEGVVLSLENEQGSLQLLAASVLTPAGADKRTIRFEKPFDVDPIVLICNGDAALTTVAVSVVRADPATLVVRTYGYRGEYRVNYLAIGVA